MTQINDNVLKVLKEKNIPVTSQEIEDGHYLHRMSFQVQKSKQLVVEMIIQNTQDPYCDAQIVYRNLHMLDDRSKEAETLSLINDLNEMKTGYYNLYLAGDGEVFLRTLMRAGEDAQPIYQTLVMGSSIARHVIQEFQEKL